MARRKGSSIGLFASLGRALDESVDMALEMRSGRMSRAEFDRWWNRRREQSRQVLDSLRERTMAMAEPVAGAVDMGRGALRTAVTSGSRSRPARSRRSDSRARRAARAARPVSRRRFSPSRARA